MLQELLPIDPLNDCMSKEALPQLTTRGAKCYPFHELMHPP